MSRIERARQRQGCEGACDGFHKCYLGYFACFNRGEYHEAHDVLEELWLETAGGDADFYKGLIQLAGAFVHLRQHAENPGHRVHGRRLHPAARLFRRAGGLLAGYAPERHGLDVTGVVELCRACAREIEASGHRCNPWEDGLRPQLAPKRGATPTVLEAAGGTFSRAGGSPSETVGNAVGAGGPGRSEEPR